ncbi:hypothetical protein [Hungatella hathewayi]|uniref:hypothetical protein n=1 Tax=Hungatella hathewayi TaxID=154046 RepID=UPI0035662FC0
MKNNRDVGYIEDIVKLSFELLDIYKAEMEESLDNARFDKEEAFLKKLYTNILSSNEKMLNNAITLLLLNGRKPKYDGSNYKNASIFMIESNGTTYNIKKDDLKNILGNEFNKTLDDLLNPKQDANLSSAKPDSSVSAPEYKTKQKSEENKTKKKKDKEPVETKAELFKKRIYKENNNQKREKILEIRPGDNELRKDRDKLQEPAFLLDEIAEEYNDILLFDEPDSIEEKKPILAAAKSQDYKSSNPKTEEKIKIIEEININPTFVDRDRLTTKETSTENEVKDISMDGLGTSDELEILIINESNQGTDLRSGINYEENISPNDMIVDDYTLEYMDKDNSIVKTISVLVTPLHLEFEDCFMTQIMVLAKCGNEMIPFVSDDINRPSVHVKINSESLIIRGSWVNGNFQTILYPQNSSNYNIVKKIKTIRPKIPYNCGHNIRMIKEDIIHVFPLASQNREDGYVNIVVCLENKKNNLYKIEKSFHTRVTEIGTYKVSANWEKGKLITLISGI